MDPTILYKFKPWVPDNAGWAGLRLLLVGESHYDEGIKYSTDQQWEHTQYVVRRYGTQGSETTPFFMRIAQTFVEGITEPTDEAYRSFWSSVCFCNYVQEFVPGRPGENKVSAAMIRRSADAFHQILDHVKPEAVLVMSAKIWGEMSEQGSELVADDVGGIGRVYRYDYQDGSCLMAHTDHPRARFEKTYRPQAWRLRVDAFLGYVGASRTKE